MPTPDELNALLPTVLAECRPVARAIFSTGRFVEGADGGVVFEIAESMTAKAAERSDEIKAALDRHLGADVPLVIRGEGAVPDRGRPLSGRPEREAPSPAPSEPEHEDAVDVTQLRDANDVAATGVERLTKAFPGAEIVEEEAR